MSTENIALAERIEAILARQDRDAVPDLIVAAREAARALRESAEALRQSTNAEIDLRESLRESANHDHTRSWTCKNGHQFQACNPPDGGCPTCLRESAQREESLDREVNDYVMEAANERGRANAAERRAETAERALAAKIVALLPPPTGAATETHEYQASVFGCVKCGEALGSSRHPIHGGR